MKNNIPCIKNHKEFLSNKSLANHTRWCEGRMFHTKTWKGDKAGISALHIWLRNKLIKPVVCDICKKRPPLDLANKTGIYNRDFINWFWLCRSCHKKYDKTYVPTTKGLIRTKEWRENMSKSITKARKIYGANWRLSLRG